MFKDVNIKQILRVMLVVLFAAFMLTACDSPKEGKTSLNADKRAALSVKDDSGQQELANQHRECWQTGIIDLLYENMGKVAMGMYAKITDGALPLMMIAFNSSVGIPKPVYAPLRYRFFSLRLCAQMINMERNCPKAVCLFDLRVNCIFDNADFVAAEYGCFPDLLCIFGTWRGNFEQYRRRKQLQGQQRCCHQVLSGTDNAEPAGNVYGTGSWPSINRKPVFPRRTEIHDELYDLCRQ